MKKDAKVFIHHILESISLIEVYSNGKTLEDFLATTSLQDMIIRRIEIIGEAVNRIKKIDKTIYEMIDESDKIICFRNVITHGYDIVDDDITWSISNEKIPILKESIRRIKEHLTD
jgi:uncharacterized protein with HEPN domain